LRKVAASKFFCICATFAAWKAGEARKILKTLPTLGARFLGRQA